MTGFREKAVTEGGSDAEMGGRTQLHMTFHDDKTMKKKIHY